MTVKLTVHKYDIEFEIRKLVRRKSQLTDCIRAEQDAQLSQRNRAAGCVTVFAKNRRLELGYNITDIIGLSSTTVI